MKRWHKLFAVLLVCLLTLGSIGYLGIQHSEKAAYADGILTPIDLGVNFFRPFGISDGGVVSGNVPYNSTYYGSRPAIWQSGTVTNLAIPSGSGGYGAAFGMSPSGETVGYVEDATVNNSSEAAKWDASGSLTALGRASATDTSCNNGYLADAANSNGDIAGYCVEGGLAKAGYWPGWAPNSFTKLSEVSNSQNASAATGINRSGHMVGWAYLYDTSISEDTFHPVYWHDGVVTDLAPAGSFAGYANAINDNDLVIGYVEFSNSSGLSTSHPYIWDEAGNTTYDLYTLTGFTGAANAVNNLGTVVGSIFVSGNPASHAFLWQKGGASIIDLNSLLPANSGWVLESADAINTNGQIVGTGLLNGQSHAFLLNTSASSSYRLSLAPASQTATIGGGQGLVKATLLDGTTSAPASNVTLAFRIEAGPNAGMSGTCFPSNCATDANGLVDWGYLGTTIGADTVQAWMDTNGNGVPDSGEAQTTATVTWIQPAQAQAYVALGDSYSSGEGAPDPNFLEGTDISKGKQINLCHRSPGAYPESVHQTTKALYSVFVFRACSGAIIQDFFTANKVGDTYVNAEGNYGEPPQLSWLNHYTGLVTLSIGGNDVGFFDVMNYCAQRTSNQPSCKDKFDKVVDADINKIKNADPNNPYTLPNLYKAIRTYAPYAEILVVGYPRLFPVNPPPICWTGVVELNGSRYFQASDMIWMNQKGEELDNAIKAAVANAGPNFAYVDPLAPNSPFNGHELCTSDSYFNRAILDRTDINVRHPSKIFQKLVSWSFHPNVSGQEALAELTAKLFKSIVQ